MKAVDFGMLRKMLVEHSHVGYGAGWYLDQITIQASGENNIQYVFSCQEWLDSGVGDRQIQRELRLLGIVKKEQLKGSIRGELPKSFHTSFFCCILCLFSQDKSIETKNTVGE